MDPLSITASAIAFVGACRKIVKGFKYLKDFSCAPEDILALTDELNDLQNTLTAIGSVTQNHRDEFVGVLLTPISQKVDHVIRELCGICGVCPERLKEAENDVYTDQLKSQLRTRFKWARKKGRVGELRERLKVVRLDLAISLVTVSLKVQYFTRLDNSPSYNALREKPTPTSLMKRLSASPAQCKPACSCTCHKEYRFKSPRLFQIAVGSLLIKSSGLYGMTQPCNEFSCRRNPSTSMRISYRFPEWFLNRMISSVIVSNQLCGPQLSLVAPRVVSNTSDIMFHALAGNIDGIARLFESGLASPFDITDNFGYTALHYAADKGHIDLCRFLLGAGARPDITDFDENTVTDIAWNKICSKNIALGEVAALEEMFKKDQWFEKRQFSILHKIVLDLLPISRSLEQELSASTSSIDLADSEGRTPLSWAAERGNALAVKTLLRYGASLSSKSILGMTPLHYAAKAPDSACLNILLNNGASVNAKNKWDQSPLNIASYFQDDSSFIATLLDHGCDINEKDCYTSTALSCATFMNNVNTARYLISRGANINSQNSLGITVLNESIENNSHECISLMLDSGADLSIADRSGETALHLIARRADLQTLRIFQGTDLEDIFPDARTHAGLTARDVFAQRVDVSADVEQAFLHLMGNLDPKSTCVRFFDAVEILPTVEVTVREVMVQ